MSLGAGIYNKCRLIEARPPIVEKLLPQLISPKVRRLPAIALDMARRTLKS